MNHLSNLSFKEDLSPTTLPTTSYNCPPWILIFLPSFGFFAQEAPRGRPPRRWRAWTNLALSSWQIQWQHPFFLGSILQQSYLFAIIWGNSHVQVKPTRLLIAFGRELMCIFTSASLAVFKVLDAPAPMALMACAEGFKRAECCRRDVWVGFWGGCEVWSLALPGGDYEFKTTHGEIGLEVIQPGEAGTAKCSTKIKMKPVFRNALVMGEWGWVWTTLFPRWLSLPRHQFSPLPVCRARVSPTLLKVCISHEGIGPGHSLIESIHFHLHFSTYIVD